MGGLIATHTSWPGQGLFLPSAMHSYKDVLTSADLVSLSHGVQAFKNPKGLQHTYLKSFS